MTKREFIESQYPDSQMLFIPDMDSAILGVDDNPWVKPENMDKDDDSKERVVYSVRGVIKMLMERDGMDYETAREYYDYNIVGGYVGVHTPVFSEDEDLTDPSEMAQDINDAWNEIEEFLTDERELSPDELRSCHDVMIGRLQKALSLLGKYVEEKE